MERSDPSFEPPGPFEARPCGVAFAVVEDDLSLLDLYRSAHACFAGEESEEAAASSAVLATPSSPRSS